MTSTFEQIVESYLDENPPAKAGACDLTARRRLVADLVVRRKDLGLTQTQVAERMGVKQPTVSGFETEESDPRLSTLQRYARAVNACVTAEVVQ